MKGKPIENIRQQAEVVTGRLFKKERFVLSDLANSNKTLYICLEIKDGNQV